jgi:hypothetical protein
LLLVFVATFLCVYQEDLSKKTKVLLQHKKL